MYEHQAITVTRPQYDKLSKMVNDLDLTKHELECVIKTPMDRSKFSACMKRMMLLYNDNIVSHDESLDIIIKPHRYTISGSANIALYCNNGAIPSDIKVINKAKISDVFIEDHKLNVRLSSETDMSNAPKLDTQKHAMKHFRLKKRFSLKATEHFRIDYTIVRTIEAISLQDSQMHDENYEVEIEYIGDLPKSKILASLFDVVSDVAAAVQNQTYLLSQSKKHRVLESYTALITPYLKNPKGLDFALRTNPRSLFIGPQIVTLERKHILRNVDSRPNKIHILDDYTITAKVDGKRVLIYIDDTCNVYVIDNNLNVQMTDIQVVQNVKNMKGTVLDAELVQYKTDLSQYHIMCFDAYIYNKELVAELHLKTFDLKSKADETGTRLAIVAKCVQNMSNTRDQMFCIHAKDFVPCTKNDMALMISQLSLLPYATDGLIFTSAKRAVGSTENVNKCNLTGTWQHTLKWKPPSQNSIDFLVLTKKFGDNINNDDVIETDNTVGKRYKTLYLHVGAKLTNPLEYYNNNRLDKNQANNNYRAKLFKPPGLNSYSTSTCKAYLDDRNVMKCIESPYDEINDNTIVEFTWDHTNGGWQPLRVRYDKTEELKMTNRITANSELNALSVWNSITYVVSNENLTDDMWLNNGNIVVESLNDDKYYVRDTSRKQTNVYTMATFHNQWIKTRQLIGTLGKVSRSVLDIACGKGGDLHKFIKSNFKTMVGIDLFEDNIINASDSAYTRLTQVSTKLPNYVYIPLDASQPINEQAFDFITDPFLKQLGRTVFGYEKNPPTQLQHLTGLAQKKFDLISCQFAIHYFFKSDETLRNFCATVNEYLLDGGHFVGTCFDGTEVSKLFNREKVDEKEDKNVGRTDNGQQVWNIKKKYDDQYDSQKTGQKIVVFVSSINKEMDEYMVGIERLEKELGKYNIRLLSSDECDGFGLHSSTELFSQAYQDMLDYQSSQKGAHENLDWIEDVKLMKDFEKEFSFLNRWFIFKKQSSTTTMNDLIKSRKDKKVQAEENEDEKPKKHISKAEPEEEKPKKKAIKKKLVEVEVEPQAEPQKIPRKKSVKNKPVQEVQEVDEDIESPKINKKSTSKASKGEVAPVAEPEEDKPKKKAIKKKLVEPQTEPQEIPKKKSMKNKPVQEVQEVHEDIESPKIKKKSTSKASKGEEAAVAEPEEEKSKKKVVKKKLVEVEVEPQAEPQEIPKKKTTKVKKKPVDDDIETPPGSPKSKKLG